MVAITIPGEYSYVLLAATSTLFVNTYHMILTGHARVKSGVKYPNAYASEEVAAKDPNAYAFNCAQRAHANFTENLTPILGSMLIGGLRFPLLAAGFGASWALFRVIYAAGYTSSQGPSGRRKGAYPSFICDLALKIMAVYTSVSFVMQQLA